MEGDATYERLLGSGEEMDVTVTPERPREKNSIVDEETGQSYVSSPGSYMPRSGKESFLSPSSSSSFLVLLILRRTKRDGIQSTAGLGAVDSQLWVGKK